MWNSVFHISVEYAMNEFTLCALEGIIDAGNVQFKPFEVHFC